MGEQENRRVWVLYSILAAAIISVAYGWVQAIRDRGWGDLYAPLIHPVSLAVTLVILAAYVAVAFKTREWLGSLVPGAIISWIVGALLYQYIL